MQENLGDIALQCELMASNAMIEAMHAGEAGQCFALQSTTLHSLSQLPNQYSNKVPRNLWAGQFIA